MKKTRNYTKGELMWLINNKGYHRIGLYLFLKDCNPSKTIKESLQSLVNNLGCHYLNADWQTNTKTW